MQYAMGDVADPHHVETIIRPDLRNSSGTAQDRVRQRRNQVVLPGDQGNTVGRHGGGCQFRQLGLEEPGIDLETETLSKRVERLTRTAAAAPCADHRRKQVRRGQERPV
jgi:hypothetical protein